MAYCLRTLPPDATRLIDEMCSQWRALTVLKAAGGTPTARCMKDVSVVAKHHFIEIRVLNSRVYLRNYITRHVCERCPNPQTYLRSVYKAMWWMWRRH